MKYNFEPIACFLDVRGDIQRREAGTQDLQWPRHIEGLKFAKHKIHADVRILEKTANVSRVLLR